MQRIRLLTSVQGAVGAVVVGDAGDEMPVPDAVADVWADGERAERVGERFDLVSLVKSATTPDVPPPDLTPTPAEQPTVVTPSPPAKTARRRRSRPATA